MTTGCLPSGDVAKDVVRDPSAENVLKALGTMLVRGVVIGAGVYAAGARGGQFWQYTAGATIATEVGVLGWAAWESRTRKNPLKKGKSKAVFRQNVAMLRREGYPEKRALAAAYRQQRES